MCLPSLTATQFNLGITYESDVGFQAGRFLFSENADFDDFTLLAATLSKPRRRKQRGRGKTKDLIGRTIAQLVQF